MKKQKVELKGKKKELAVILIGMLIVALFFSGYSLGKEYSTTNIKANAKIAEPILIVENSPELEINGRKEREYYDFRVKNYRENGETTQVDLTYYIEILSQKDEAISFKLYKEGKEISLQNNKTDIMKMKKKDMQEDYYKLEIIYDKTKNKSIEDILQDVQIKVHSEQMKT